MTNTEISEADPDNSMPPKRWRTGVKQRVAEYLRHPGKLLFPLFGLGAIAFMTAQVVGFHAGVFPLSAIALILVVTATLGGIPRKKFASFFVSTFGWLPVTIGSLSYFFWYSYAENFDPPESDFFHAAADVLPVLLLAAVLDVRRSKTLESKGLILPIIAVFLGEIAALNSLAFGYAGPGDFAAVSASLVSTTVALVLAVLADFSEPPDSSAKLEGAREPAEDDARDEMEGHTHS